MYYLYLASDRYEFTDEEYFEMRPKIEKLVHEEFVNTEIKSDKVITSDAENMMTNLDNISEKFNFKDRLEIKTIAYRLNVLADCDLLMFIGKDCRYTDTSCKMFYDAAIRMGIPIYEYDPQAKRMFILNY